MRILGFWLTLLLALAPGCSEDGDDDTGIGDDDVVGDDDDIVGDDDDTTSDDARIEVTPDSLEFDGIGIGCSFSKYVSVINVGSGSLEITDLEIVSSDDEFGVELDVPLDTPLASGTVARATVEYAPVNETGDTASLFIRSNDPVTPEVHVGITGSFVGTALVENEFMQVDTPSVDVLWVLDNSSSMADEQDFLKSVIPTFLDVAVPPDWLLHLAVVTTDSNHLRGTPHYLSTDMPDVSDQFSELIAVGTDGSDDTRGLEMGTQAITPPLGAPGGINDGFLREPAGLLIVDVSDSDDESPDTVSAYVNLFQSLLVDPDQVRIVTVTGGIAGCTSAIATADAAPRYVQAAGDSGGVDLSICDATWMDGLATLDWEELGWRWTFELSQEPDQDTIEVEVDGVVVTEGWSYSETYNAVKFDEAGLPEAGVGVVVRYAPLPECWE